MMLSMSPTTPGAQGHQLSSYGNSPPSARSQAFKRPIESDDEDDQNGDQNNSRMPQVRRNPAVKRACNECRQQKLRCNVQQDPFVSCARCVKHKLNCVIEPHFKRIGKRSRNAEMEREMADLRERLAAYEGKSTGSTQPTLNTPHPTSEVGAYNTVYQAEEDDSYLQPSNQAVAASSLLELRSGSPMFHALGDVKLSSNQINELFAEFFQNYHPFLSFLDPLRSPEDYGKDSRLLFWSIISVAARRYEQDLGLLIRLKEPLTSLIWQTTSKIPQNHQVVKALCLLCTWPLPTSRTSTDPTFMLCGLMMQIAMQIGLHQPTHPQDFSRLKLHLRQEDISDRMRTWAVCNIVAQTVSTGYGQPSFTLYDSMLGFKTDDEDHMKVVPPALFVRLRQEMAASRITKLLYSSNGNRLGDKRSVQGSRGGFYADLEADRLKEEFGQFDGVDTAMEHLHYYAVFLHLRLYAFFDTESITEGRKDLMDLYFAATDFLKQAFKFFNEDRLKYVPYYMMQMILAAGFALLKLLNSEFSSKLPFHEGRHFVYQTIEAMRKSRVEQNDLPDRLAEVLAQLWKASSSGRSVHSMTQSPAVPSASMNMSSMISNASNQPPQLSHSRRESSAILEDPLRLMIRSRMSMSVVFDSIWRWRESQVNGAAEQLDTTVVNNPTNPDSSNNSTPPHAAVQQQDVGLPNTFNPHFSTLSAPLQLPNGLASANSFEIFDPVSWMLDAQQPEWNYGAFGHDFGA